MIVLTLGSVEWLETVLAVVAGVVVMCFFIVRLMTREVEARPGSPGYRPSVQDLADRIAQEREVSKPAPEPDYGDPNEVTVPLTKMELLAFPGLYERTFGE